MVDTVLFDLDNTLLDFNKAEKIAVERTLREMGVTPDERMLKRYSELNLAQWHLLEQGKITRSQVKVQRYVNLFREYHIEGDQWQDRLHKLLQLLPGHLLYDTPGTDSHSAVLSPEIL